MSTHTQGRTLCTGNPVSGALSALHVLRSYNLFAPSSDLYGYEAYPSRDYNITEAEILQNSSTVESSSPLTSSPLSAAFSLSGNLLQAPFLTTIPPLMHSVNIAQPYANSGSAGAMMTRHLVGGSGIASIHRRPRSEKKPIPDEQKDEKYYERRKRNNQAAKKSRDARKIREDHIALRATILEHENAILRAQIVTLREEAQSLRHMLIKQQASVLSSVTVSPTRPIVSLDCQV